MAVISSHVLDSVTGTHASGIRVECYQRMQGGQTAKVFDVIASAEGRISEQVHVDADADYDLVFHSAAYFESVALPDDGYQVVKSIVVRIALPDPNDTYHFPIMLAPHSYSIWWSGKPPVKT